MFVVVFVASWMRWGLGRLGWAKGMKCDMLVFGNEEEFLWVGFFVWRKNYWWEVIGGPDLTRHWQWVPMCVFNYKNVIELWVMETENSQNMFSVSITHNSKIRELSDGNRVMKTKLSFAKRILSYGSHHFWVMSYRNWELSYENRPSKQPFGIEDINTKMDLIHGEGVSELF